MKKDYVIFGGFDYAVKWEMNQDSIYRGIDYFVEIDDRYIGKKYLGKEIFGVNKLIENRGKIFILIGSVVNYTEYLIILKELGFEEDVDYVWALGWPGDKKCDSLWYSMEWSDKENAAGQKAAETSLFSKKKYELVAKMLPDKCHCIYDLGGATGMLAEYLSEKKYVCVDYIKYSEEQLVCNLNEYEFPEIKEGKEEVCFVLCGIIQYVKDWKWLLKNCTEKADTIILSHNDVVRINRDFRREHLTWKNAVFNHSVILEMQKLGFRLTDAYDHQLKVVVMRFERV